MDARMNQLLEEAITECGRLSDESKEAAPRVAATAEHAEQLLNAAASKGETAFGHLQALADSMEAKDHEAEELVGTTARAAFDAIDAKSKEVEEQAGLLADGVEKHAEDLDEEADQMESNLDERMTAAEQDFEQRVEQIQQLQTAVATQLAQAQQNLDTLRSRVTAALEALGNAKNEWIAQLGQTDTEVRQQVQAQSAAITHLLHAQTTAFIGLANRMIGAHNPAVVAVRKALAEEAPEKFRAATTAAAEVLDRLIEACQETEPALTPRCDAVLQVVSDAVESMEKVQSAAAQTANLL